LTAVRVEFGGGRFDALSPDFFHISHVSNKIIKKKGKETKSIKGKISTN
jgi:hypothetical protein